MAQIAKLQVEAEIKASAGKFYEVFRSKGYLLPKICPDMISDLRVIQGDWGTVGSVKEWTYVAAVFPATSSSGNPLGIVRPLPATLHRKERGEEANKAQWMVGGAAGRKSPESAKPFQLVHYEKGKSETAKEIVEAMDEKTKSITFKTVDGLLLKVYKNMKATFQVTAKDGGCSSVKWSIEYEKLNEDSPPPNKYLDFVLVLTKKVDAHLLKA